MAYTNEYVPSLLYASGKMLGIKNRALMFLCSSVQ